MRRTERIGLACALVFGAVALTSSVALSEGPSASHASNTVSRPGASVASSTPTGKCTKVGWVSTVSERRRRAHLRLSRASKSCVCPGGKCTRLARGQHLFGDEELYSGGGKITFKSSVRGIASLTCKMPRNATNVIYPSSANFKDPNTHAVLHLKSGATSCQVEQGEWQSETTEAVFIVRIPKSR